MPPESGQGTTAAAVAPSDAGWIEAQGLPPGVRGLMTTRTGGVSRGPFASMNLRPPVLGGDDVDEPSAVLENQWRLREHLGAQPVFLDQVHGRSVVRLDGDDARAARDPLRALPRADASITTVPGVACTVLVADCLPVLLADARAGVVGAAHAGWRGLAAGVLERTVEAMATAAGARPARLVAWLGACIGPDAFEVGADVLTAFGVDPSRVARPTRGAARHFRYAPRADGSPRWRADLAALARDRLRALGVECTGGRHGCTVSDASRFFSFRRERVTGRMAACIWLDG